MRQQPNQHLAEKSTSQRVLYFLSKEIFILLKIMSRDWYNRYITSDQDLFFFSDWWMWIFGIPNLYCTKCVLHCSINFPENASLIICGVNKVSLQHQTSYVKAGFYKIHMIDCIISVAPTSSTHVLCWLHTISCWFSNSLICAPAVKKAGGRVGDILWVQGLPCGIEKFLGSKYLAELDASDYNHVAQVCRMPILKFQKIKQLNSRFKICVLLE